MKPHCQPDTELVVLRLKISEGCKTVLLKLVRSASLCCAMGMAMLGSVAHAQSADIGEPITPVPQHTELNAPKVALGKKLFADSRLSGGNGVACTSCHLKQFGLTDGRALSPGLPGWPGQINTPTLYNVSLNALFSWSGQIKTLHDQADGVIERTMGGHWPDVVATLNRDSELTKAFDSIYDDGLVRKNVVDALVEYERSLNTPDAPFDRYLRGEENAISAEAKAGYGLFKDYGCASCHQGVNVGGNMMQVFGIFGTPPGAEDGASTHGSAKATGISDREAVFRVPSLRNVAKTAPYFHNGSAATLPDAINVMAINQLGRDLSTEEVARLEAFLESLTGEHQGFPVGNSGQ